MIIIYIQIRSGQDLNWLGDHQHVEQEQVKTGGFKQNLENQVFIEQQVVINDIIQNMDTKQ